ncbi:DUF4279 domain-containing protein [Mucilaginibacter gotjawali]|uniref:Uncharacterized protein n=2 Tax=Mucilaginibacter gotjawali TaxID=1550579 RepID=A0A839SB49_9SPHI|nr:DUF4279 domain-containing protein [Mucilaginibacter gotjawali]MBB3054190.1 hypothetical protein [Mucilaginibacter gotjawali]BAU54461.1 hypothetical protein MgSA37_02637 [Mucilaginibacter gotjawali]
MKNSTLSEENISQELVDKFLEISIREFEERTWGSTQQFLEVLEIAIEDGKPLITRVQYIDSGYAVYFKIKGSKFYYTHYFEVDSAIELIGIDITPSSIVLLRVLSNNLDLQEILSKTSLPATSTWQKGDMRPPKKLASFVYKTSGFEIELDKNHAGQFERKILELLNYLKPYQKDLALLKKAGCELFVDTYWEAYISNTLIGGFSLNQKIIRQLDKLGLEISFDIQVNGNPLK